MTATAPVDSFRHEALVYAGDGELVESLGAFVREGVAAGEPVLVVLRRHKLDMLREWLGNDVAHVRLADMDQVGANPARIIPAWRDFVRLEGATGRLLRGVGEPIWAGRDRDALVESQRHEALLNVAFAGAPAWWLLCPYDAASLPPDVLAEAERTHPWMRRRGQSASSGTYVDPLRSPQLPLSVVPGDALGLVFDAASLAAARRPAARCAARAGLGTAQVADLTTAVNEVAENSLRHGGGRGTLRAWQEGDTVLCEVRDAGHIADPLADRIDPGEAVEMPRGLWLANALCDLVQIRTAPAGTTVRLHMRRRRAA
jgi:anti-sigma regulatory factor (Ser/Thr protein kinase)